MAQGISSLLESRVRDFLATVRLGIDFGEHAGGIAVVKGNRVLHAETFLDFHEATLEQRRILRRGRRSRHAKKMRLARLRSWVLRQRLPNGDRLPDPYSVMRNPQYMVQPGIYLEKGTAPLEASSWIQLAKEGKADTAGFVRALTLIFQKRGYKWDAIALEEMTDVKLKDFLLTARTPTDDPALSEKIRAQIARRKLDPADPVRGKTKVQPEELERLLQLACERGQQPARPRLAEHRSIKEADLRAVIEGFEKAAALPKGLSDRWKQELCKLLNKVLRPARFENRLKTGCAWCGRATPRKAKVRELAYKAAVNNLRKREGFRTKPLADDDDDRKMFLGWWDDPKSAPGADTIAQRLEKLNKGQKRMARQFYDLLKNPDAKGRASLCVEHLKMAADGKTMKDAGVEWQRIAVRKAPNPCGESRDTRILRRLEQILFKPGTKGNAAWRHGPVSLINIEIPEPATEQAAKGQQKKRQEETLKDRLARETDGCVYKVLGACAGEADKDHIFPRSRGGPDVRMNLVAACIVHNKEKGSQTPFEWLGGRDSSRWQQFQRHVEKLDIADLKRRILLNETTEYPEGDPTPFARVGARPRQFVVAVGKLYDKYGLPPPQIHYELRKPLIQRIQGSETHWFRLSWSRRPDGTENFPYPKDRSTLFNHAEDAALLAAVPPHTWRALTRIHTAERPLLDGKLGPKSGLVIPQLAPDWQQFLETRRAPLIRILGRYPVTWKNKFADLTFWRKPNLDTPRVKRTKPLQDLQRKDFRNTAPEVRGILEQIAEAVGLGQKGTISTALARQLAGEGAKGAAVDRERPRAIEELQRRYPGLRRVQVSSQKGGTLAVITPGDGPARKVQIKPASEGVLVWQWEHGKRRKRIKTEISVIRPRPLLRFGFPRVDPPLPLGATVIGQLYRHQIVWVEGQSDRPEGYYRVTKCQRAGVTLVPEESVPAEIARRMGGRVASEGAEVEEEADEVVRVLLGKRELAKYFAKERNDDVR